MDFSVRVLATSKISFHSSYFQQSLFLFIFTFPKPSFISSNYSIFGLPFGILKFGIHFKFCSDYSHLLSFLYVLHMVMYLLMITYK